MFKNTFLKPIFIVIGDSLLWTMIIIFHGSLLYVRLNSVKKLAPFTQNLKFLCGSLYFSAFITKFDSLSLNVFIKSLDSLFTFILIYIPNSLWLSILIENPNSLIPSCINLNRRLASIFNVNLCNKLVMIYYCLSKYLTRLRS